MDAQALLDLIRANEEAPGFKYRPWTCGSYGCLLGNYVIRYPGRVATTYQAAAEYFGISLAMSMWLFSPTVLLRWKWGFVYSADMSGCPLQDPEMDRPQDDVEPALNRVRKLVYYYLHKRELCYKDDGRVKESARRTEGDHHVCRRALELAIS